MKEQERSTRSLEMGTARVEAFSDAVMAVIITIMAFELRAPRGASLGAVYDQLPGLLVYMLSFVVVGIYWNNHHHPAQSGRAVQRGCYVGEPISVVLAFAHPSPDGMAPRRVSPPASRCRIWNCGARRRVRVRDPRASAHPGERP